MHAPYTVERLSPKDIDALFDFRLRVLPKGPKQQDRQRWSWLYEANPLAPAQPMCWILKTENRIAGSISAMTYRARIQQEVISVLHCADFFVEEGFRGLPAVRLLKAIHAHGDLYLGTNYSAAAHKLVTQLGYVDLSHGFKCASTFLAGQARPSGRLRLKSSLWNSLKVLGAAIGFRTRLLNGVPYEYDALWEHIDQQRNYGLIKDRAFLKWRYEDCPRGPFTFVGCYRDDRLRALAILQVQRTLAAKPSRALIFDLLVPARDHVALTFVISSCLVHLSEQGCPHCELHSDLSWLRPALTAIGFRFVRSELGLLVLIKGASADRLQPMLTRSAWSLSLGDSDRF